MLQYRVFHQLIQRARGESRSPSHIVDLVASGLLVALLVGCGQSGRASAPPVRELAPVSTDVALGGGVVIDGTAVAGVETARTGDEALQISPPSCRTVFDPERAQSASEQQSPVQLILDAVRVAQDDDARCGQRRTEEIYCRALWLLEVLDPIVIAFDPSVSPDERLEAAASLDWALRMAVDAPTAAEEATTVEESVAPEGPNSITGEGDVLVVSVGNGFAQLRPLTSRLAEALKGVDGTSRLVAEDEEHLALLIKARAHPSILEPLSAMQTVCLLGT